MIVLLWRSSLTCCFFPLQNIFYLQLLLRQPEPCTPRSWSVLTLLNQCIPGSQGTHGSCCLSNSWRDTSGGSCALFEWCWYRGRKNLDGLYGVVCERCYYTTMTGKDYPFITTSTLGCGVLLVGELWCNLISLISRAYRVWYTGAKPNWRPCITLIEYDYKFHPANTWLGYLIWLKTPYLAWHSVAKKRR